MTWAATVEQVSRAAARPLGEGWSGAIMNGDEPAVQQEPLNGWSISWNPDDNRFYVERGDHAGSTFRELRNARYWARRH